MTMRVVTYREAYRPEVEVDVCDRCAEDRARVSMAGFGPLGAVQYGMHSGTCDVCQEVTIRGRKRGSARPHSVPTVQRFSDC